MRCLIKYILSSVAALALAISGCRSHDHRHASDSAPDLKTGNISKGELILEAMDKPPTPSKGAPAPLYTVYDEQGKQVARPSTMSTTLPAGRYRVHMERAEADVHEFWVTIESGKTTRVDVSKVKEGETNTVD